MKSPILGSSYVARSVNAADNRMVNLFPEIVPEGGKEPAFLQRAPALVPANQLGSGAIRGVYTFYYDLTSAQTEILLIVSGDTLYIKDDFSDVPNAIVGTISGSGVVSFADNGTQVFITSGIYGSDAYIYDHSTLTLTQITDADFTSARTVTYLDGFFVFNETTGSNIWVTGLRNGLTIDADDVATADGSPDGVVAVKAIQDELWVFGANSTEVWYNAGTAGFPFAPIQGAFNEVGCSAPNTIAKLDNTLFWLGQDSRGRGVVYKANGYRAERVSTHAIEWQIQQYIENHTDVFDAVAYSYQQDGHAFYVLTLPQDDKTWVYDVATGAWHERAGYSAGAFTRDQGNSQASAFGYNWIGSYDDDTLYYYSTDQSLSAGGKWLRSWRALPTGQNNLKRAAHHSLQLDIETGEGLSSTPSVEPEVDLRFSDDGGHTWSNVRSAGMGLAGEYGKRVIWRRLGMTMKLRDRVYEISGTDLVKIFINGAELLMSPTDA